MAKVLMTFGLAVFLIGALLYFFPGALNWFGRLPGDIRIKNDNSAFYFPITTMILISVVLSVVLSLAAHFFRR